jgi:hypothetical protein
MLEMVIEHCFLSPQDMDESTIHTNTKMLTHLASKKAVKE